MFLVYDRPYCCQIYFLVVYYFLICNLYPKYYALISQPRWILVVLQVATKKQTLKNVTDYITDIICKRAELGYNYGVILIPEGLIDFIPEVNL